MPEGFSLEGKVAFIAGYFDRVTEVITLALAEAGADIALAPTNKIELREIEDKVKEYKRRLLITPIDMTDSQGVQSSVKNIISGLGEIDILVNSSRLQFAKPFLEISEDEWHRVIDVNLTGTFLCSKVVGEQMLKQKRGRIINLISALSERGLSNCAALCASLGGVHQLTRALAIEWARHGIRINAIAPGWLSTEVSSIEKPMEEALLKYIPMGRCGQPEELGALAVLLASDSCDYITGQIFLVDGGISVRP